MRKMLVLSASVMKVSCVSDDLAGWIVSLDVYASYHRELGQRVSRCSLEHLFCSVPTFFSSILLHTTQTGAVRKSLMKCLVTIDQHWFCLSCCPVFHLHKYISII